MSKKAQPKKATPPPAAIQKQTAAAQPKTASTKTEQKAEGQKMPLYTMLSVILAALAILLYINTLQNGFVLDDVIMVKDNTIVAKGFAGIGELLATPHMRGYLIIPNDTYRPLSLVMFAIEHQFFGQSPAPYHLVNVLVFALCVLMFFRFLHEFMGRRNVIAAFIGAFLFAIHPTHTEVVANIKSRDELLCFLFAFMALNAYMKFAKEAKMGQLLLGTSLLYLSYISKENTITFLGVIPLLFFLYKNEQKSRSMMIAAASVVVAVAFIVVRALVLKAYDANVSTDIEFIDNALVKAPSLLTRIATAIFISGKYLWLLVVPYPLICNYSFNSIPFKTFGDPEVIAAALVYGGLIFYAIRSFIRKQSDPFAFAIVYYLMTIALFNNMFILIGAQMGERFLFMPSAGICMAAAFAADKWLIPNAHTIADLKKPMIAIALILSGLAFGGMTIARNIDWRDNVSLYRADVPKSPNDCRLAYYLGTALAENGYAEEPDPEKRKAIDEEALTHLRRAVAMYPDFTEANAELGRVFDRQQKYDSAEYYDLRAIKLNPNHTIATNNLGSVYLETGRYDLAAQTFRKAIAINPSFNLAYFNLARTVNQLKQYDSAIYYYNKALIFEPNNVDAFQEKGMAFFSLNRYDSAEQCFKMVLRLKPDESSAINNLGAIYLNTKNYPSAIEQFNRSISLNPNYVNAYSNLGRAYYFNKQYQQAIDAFLKQINLNNKAYENIPYIALSYKELGNISEAKKYEAIAQRFYSDFKL
jgi:protein O-mannosyl-transferase